MAFKLLTGMALFIGAQLHSCMSDDVPPKGPDNIKKQEIESLVETFGKSLKEKDRSTHTSLFLTPTSPINFEIKNYGTPFIYSFNATTWTDFFTAFDYDYYAIYGKVETEIQGAAAISNHHFDSYKNGTHHQYGNDMFMYVKTPAGLKILSINTTLVDAVDSTEYATLTFNSTRPEKVLYQFEDNINKQDYAAYSAALLNESAPCLFIKKLLTEAYSDARHSAKAFYDSWPVGTKLRLLNVKAARHDQLTASVSAEYEVVKNGCTIGNGTMLATAVCAKDTPWKISTAVFSIK